VPLRPSAVRLSSAPVRIGLAMLFGFLILIGILLAVRPDMMSGMFHMLMDTVHVRDGK
jgi:hypothetical protein